MISLKQFKNNPKMEYNFLVREDFQVIEVYDDKIIVLDGRGRPIDLKFREQKWDEMVDKLNYLHKEVKKIPGTRRFSKQLDKITSLLGRIQDERLSYHQKNDLEPLFYYQNIKLYELFDKIEDKLEPIKSEIFDFVFLFIFFVNSFYGNEEEFKRYMDKKYCTMDKGDYNG